MAEEIAALQESRRSIARRYHRYRNLELIQGLFEQFHFLVSQAEVVMSFVVAVAAGFGFALGREAILFKDFGEARINLIAGRRRDVDITGRCGGDYGSWLRGAIRSVRRHPLHLKINRRDVNFWLLNRRLGRLLKTLLANINVRL